LKYIRKNSLRRHDPILLKIIPPIAAFFIKSLMLSCRVIKIDGLEKVNEAIAMSNGGAVFATWHQRMSYHFHYFGSRHVTMMISQSRDGEYAAHVASWLGFKNVRGSSNRGGSRAMKKLVRKIREGETGGMLADGPLGPARVAKMGSVLIARDAGVPLIPVVWGADRCWVFNSWDRYMVPKPFAKVAIFWAEPIWIPLSADGDELEGYRQIFEDHLNAGSRWCDIQFNAERPWKKES
jgi:lysophospholipid acyltransferase (LPLAT)-like uncharacterized protein